MTAHGRSLLASIALVLIYFSFCGFLVERGLWEVGVALALLVMLGVKVKAGAA